MLWIVGTVGLICGGALFLVDHLGTTTECLAWAPDICRTVRPSDRGTYLAAGAVLILVVTAIAWSALTPPTALTRRQQLGLPPQQRKGRGLLFGIVWLFTLFTSMAAIDVLIG